MKKDHYTELKKTFTDEEISESFILPSDLSDDEQKLANEEFSKFLKERKMSSLVESEPSEFKPPIIENVGEEFIKWAEQGWAFERIFSKGLGDDGSESCPYPLYKKYIINKINELVEIKMKQ
jgi:hypothetical protein